MRNFLLYTLGQRFSVRKDGIPSVPDRQWKHTLADAFCGGKIHIGGNTRYSVRFGAETQVFIPQTPQYMAGNACRTVPNRAAIHIFLDRTFERFRR